MESYNVKADMLIDSTKGLGDWFEAVPLYTVYKTTKKPELLPQYYFKGKYIKPSAPPSFIHLYDVPESGKRGGMSQIYRTPYISRQKGNTDGT